MHMLRPAGALLVVLTVCGATSPAQISPPQSQAEQVNGEARGRPCGVLRTAVCRVTHPDGVARAAETERTERLAALGRVWTAVRYGHPYLAYRDIDWDAALVAAIPGVLQANDSRAFGAAVQGMLDALGDPATRVIDRQLPPGAPEQPARGGPRPPLESLEDVVVVRLTDVRDVADMSRVVAEMQREMPKLRDAAAVVVDLRTGTSAGAGAMRMVFAAIGPALAARPVATPPIRTWVHSGYRPQSGSTSGGYFSALQTIAGDVIAPGPGVKPKRVAFLVSPQSEIPGVALALQQSGDGVIVAEGGVSEVAGIPTMAVPLSDQQAVRIRTGEVIYPDRPGVRADVLVPPPVAGAADAAMAAALAYVRGGLRPAPTEGTTPADAGAVAQPAWRADRAYPEMSHPTLEYRLLALYRLWGVLDAFFPYKHLLSRDWDLTLAEFIPKFEAARDAREYALVVAEMAARTEDTHVGVTGSAELTRLFGEAPSPAVLRYIEGVPVVTAFLDIEVAGRAGLEIGDEILKVDGEDIGTRAALLGRYLAASNPQAHRDKIARRLLSGPDGSEVRLDVRGAGGVVKSVSLLRRRSYQAVPVPRAGEVVRILDGNIGYADLTRLTVPQVEAMFDTVRTTDALIFDMRGYPRGTAWAIAPRINTRNARDAALFVRPMVSGGDTLMKTTFLQPIPQTTAWKYTAPTVMLIDERAISQSEHTGLFFEAANDTTFIGTPTAGANGDVTRLVLPGGLTVGFTGHDVRHADGRQLQKIGLTPHVLVAPTIEGIRSGRDEVLDRAMRYLRERLGSATK